MALLVMEKMALLGEKMAFLAGGKSRNRFTKRIGISDDAERPPAFRPVK